MSALDRRQQGLRETLRLARPGWRGMLPGLLAGLLASGSAVALLATSAWLITKSAEHPPIMHLGFAIVGVRAFALGRAVFRYLERLASHDAAFRALGELRAGVFERLIPAAPAALGGLGRGELLARMVRDVDALQDHPLRVLQPLLTAGLVALGSVALIAAFSPAAAAVLAGCALVAVLLGWGLSALLAARSDRALGPLRGRLQQALLELVDRLEVLIAFDALESRLTGIAALDAELRRAERRSALSAGLVAALVLLLAGAASLGALLVALPALATGALEGPGLALVVLTPIAVFEVLAAVTMVGATRRRVHSAAERVAGVVPEPLPAEVPEEDRAPEQPAADPSPATRVAELELRRFSAAWPGSPPAVRDLGLRLRAGDRLLVTGPSGSGKSTLAAALVRFIEHGGDYLIDGREARGLGTDAVRRRVGLCEQQPHLFDASLRANLAFARPGADDEALLAVLRRVGLAEWAAARGGLDAPLGERGALVSGGQAQRIALARALLAEFPVLVLDEPTANVQPELGAALLADALAAAAGDERIVILISHVPVDDALITQRVTLA